MKVTIAAKDDVFDKLFEESTRAVVLDGEAAEVEYVRKHDRLRKAVSLAARRLFDDAFVQANVFLSDNWWPNQTCYVEASLDSISQDFFHALRATLGDDFAGWRIQLVIHSDLDDGKTMIGSIAVWREELLIDRALYAILRWRGIDFGGTSEPVWHEGK